MQGFKCAEMKLNIVRKEMKSLRPHMQPRNNEQEKSRETLEIKREKPADNTQEDRFY